MDLNNSNTTLVKVKSEQQEIDTLYGENSNTTLVKVKFNNSMDILYIKKFKYNTC